MRNGNGQNSQENRGTSQFQFAGEHNESDIVYDEGASQTSDNRAGAFCVCPNTLSAPPEL